jgi:serpin B
MYRKAAFSYMQNEILQAVELPYIGNDLGMVILLPRGFDGLASLEQMLKPRSLSIWLTRLQQMPEVEVYLPKFKTIDGFGLKETLATLGMSDGFDSYGANFSGIAKSGIYLSSVIHEAYVDVNEEGTEAAAATAVEGGARPIVARKEYPPIVFRADHPFVFLIRDESTGAILFMGRVTDPRE